MKSQMKRKHRAIRNEFKADLYAIMKNNKAFAMMVMTTYTASKHRSHIMDIWSLLAEHQRAYRAYSDELFGKMLTGEDTIMNSIYYADKDLYLKYIRKIPECYAMGDARSVAISILNKKE